MVNQLEVMLFGLEMEFWQLHLENRSSGTTVILEMIFYTFTSKV